MQEFTRELVSLVDAMRRIHNIQKANAQRSRGKEVVLTPWRSLRSHFGGLKRGSTMRGRPRADLRKRLCEHPVLLSATQSLMALRCGSRIILVRAYSQESGVPEDQATCAKHKADPRAGAAPFHAPARPDAMGYQREAEGE